MTRQARVVGIGVSFGASQASWIGSADSEIRVFHVVYNRVRADFI